MSALQNRFLAKNAVTTEKINDGAVTSNKLADSVINDMKFIAAGILNTGDGLVRLQGGKVPVNLLPSAIMEYKGVLDAATNDKALTDYPSAAAAGDNVGNVYRVTTAGTIDFGEGRTISFEVGDYAILNADGKWEKSDTTDAVASVNGKVGIVDLDLADFADVQQAIQDEATARANADSGLDTRLGTAENTINSHGDTLLTHGTRITNLETNLGLLDEEVDALNTNLSLAISEEITARTNADAGLQTAIDNEVTARTNADAGLQTSIDNEVTARTNADAALQTAIDNEVTARTDADAALQTAIDNEVTARTNADTALSGRMTTAEGEIDALQSLTNGLALPRTRLVEVTQAMIDSKVFAFESAAQPQGTVSLFAVGGVPQSEEIDFRVEWKNMTDLTLMFQNENEINFGGTPPSWLVPGAKFALSGALGNNGTYTVTSRGASTVVVDHVGAWPQGSAMGTGIIRAVVVAWDGVAPLTTQNYGMQELGLVDGDYIRVNFFAPNV